MQGETFILWKIISHDQYTWQDRIYGYLAIQVTLQTLMYIPALLLPVPPQALLLKLNPIHSHRPLHDSHKGYVEHSMSAP